jgi:hypothetical protein
VTNFEYIRLLSDRGSTPAHVEPGGAEYGSTATEHEVAFDLDRAAHADEPREIRIYAFGHGLKIKTPVVPVGMWISCMHDVFSPFGPGFVRAAIVALDDRRMAVLIGRRGPRVREVCHEVALRSSTTRSFLEMSMGIRW